MSLFHPRILDKYSRYVTDPSESAINLLKTWASNLAEGRFDGEIQNDSEFIQKILIEIFGYKGSSSIGNWTISKNINVGKGNVDIALGHFDASDSKILAPFELKGAKTKDLDAIMPGRNKTPVQQAWEYAIDTKGAKWVILSNYNEIRLYAVGYGRQDYEVFYLNQLYHIDAYKKAMLLLSAENLLNGKTQEILEESEQRGKDITVNLYLEYKQLRLSILDNLISENPEIENVKLLTYTNTILDRIVFIAFAEDKGLLPPNTLLKVYETVNPYSPQPIWSNYKGLFKAIDTGNNDLKIPGYNGGLFRSNAELDGLNLSDCVCEQFKKIGMYDFESDVSVNILGHIFEQSIADIEILKTQLKNESPDTINVIQKRKDDGVYYTPSYITRYIVEQTIGTWLSHKKEEIGFPNLPTLNESDFASIRFISKGPRKGRVSCNDNVSKHIRAWEAYKEILINIKVIDPACGSGAFLNEAFDFLLKEGRTVNNELTRLNGGQLQLFRWDTHILSNNLYGVDVNLESVEISKLSLWLKTANKNEKLTYLDDNIKHGNSLIWDKNIIGQIAFNWNAAFNEIMESGGFDIVIGNPPYGASLSKREIDWISENYQCYEYQVNTYVLFYEVGINILKKNGIIGFITPSSFTYQHYFKKIRNLLSSYEIISLCKHSFQVFKDANIGDTISFILKKSDRKNSFTQIKLCNNKLDLDNNHILVSYNDLISREGIYHVSSKSFIENLYDEAIPLGNCVKIITAGIKPYQKGKGVPKQNENIVKERPFTSLTKISNEHSKCFIGKNFHQYRYLNSPCIWIKYGDHLAEPRKGAPFFEDEKIIIRQTADSIIAHLDTTKSFNLNNVYNIGCPVVDISLKCLLAILNSKLINACYRSIAQEKGKLFAEVKKVYLEKLPIKIPHKHLQARIDSIVDKIIENYNLISSKTDNFIDLVNADLKINVDKELFYSCWSWDNGKFINEIKKAGANLSLPQKNEWIIHFDKEKAIIKEFHDQIIASKNNIDTIIYKHYGIKEESISEIENNL